MARIVAYLARIVVVNCHLPLALSHSFTERGHNAVASLLAGCHSIHNQLNRVGFVTVELLATRKIANYTINAGVDISFAEE